jgi:predicted metalloprotease
VVLALQLCGHPEIAQVVSQMTQGTGQTYSTQGEVELTAEQEEQGTMVAVMLKDMEDVWAEIFTKQGKQYRNPTCVLFSGSVQTACGGATSDVGPFYCPGDEKLYMDMTFFNELHTTFGAELGDFTVAYVMAHEVGHHVQKLLGTSDLVTRKQRSLSETEGNKWSVALELQADFYAGIFAHYDKAYLESGDIDEALSAANAVGDDAIQKKMQGRVVPEAFTHGTSEQRKYWFKLGYDTGDMSKGEGTFDNLR